MNNLEKISAFVIAFNEEENIVDCLRSLSFCDEIIVIDSFSTDRTVELAKQLGARVIQKPWSGYVAQKSYGLSQVTHEWVLNLDADERVSEELRENIVKVLSSTSAVKNEINGFYINRLVYHLGRWWKLGGWYPEYRLRLFRRSKTRWGGIDPHEKPIVEGRKERLAGDTLHFTYRDLHDQIQRLINFAHIAAKQEREKGKKSSLRLLLVNPLLRMVKFYFFKRGFREGIAGLIVAIFEGFYTFLKYAHLWELENNARMEKSNQKLNLKTANEK